MIIDQIIYETRFHVTIYKTRFHITIYKTRFHITIYKTRFQITRGNLSSLYICLSYTDWWTDGLFYLLFRPGFPISKFTPTLHPWLRPLLWVAVDSATVSAVSSFDCSHGNKLSFIHWWGSKHPVCVIWVYCHSLCCVNLSTEPTQQPLEVSTSLSDQSHPLDGCHGNFLTWG